MSGRCVSRLPARVISCGMTQPIQTTRVEYEAVGTTTGPFVVPFRFFLAGDLRVEVNGVEVPFTAAGMKTPTGGTITLVTAAADGDTVVIWRDTAPERETDFPETGPFRIGKLNHDLDRLTAVDQDIQTRLDRMVQGPADEEGLDALPGADARAGRMLAFDDTTGQPEVTPFTTDQVAAVIDAATLNLVISDAEQFEGDGVEDSFALPTAWGVLVSRNSVLVDISGTGIQTTDYNIVDGATLGDAGRSYIVFDTPPPKYAPIEVRIPPAASGTGTVTEINTGTLLTGGPITGTGTISVANVAQSTVLGRTASGTGAPSALSAPMVSVITAANAAAARTVLGAGTGNGDVTGPASSTDSVMALFDGTTGKLLKAGAAPFTNPMTTMGDMIIGGASGAPFRLALAAPNTFLTSNGSTPAYRTIALTDLPSQADLTVLARNAGTAGTPTAVSTPMLSVIAAANAAAARTALVAAGSGAVTSSGLTMATARLLGRSTASTGAIEEITVGSGLSLTAGTLSASGGANPGMVLLSVGTASNSATIDITGLDSTYDVYVLEMDNVRCVSNGVRLVARVQVSATWQTGDYYTSGIGNSAASPSPAGAGSALQAWIDLTRGQTISNASSNYCFSGQVRLYSPSATGTIKNVLYSSAFANGGSDPGMNAFGSGAYTGSGSAVTGIRIFATSGNIDVGNFRLYGLRKTV